MLAVLRRPTRSSPSYAAGAKRHVLRVLPDCGQLSDRALKRWRAAQSIQLSHNHHKSCTVFRWSFHTHDRDDQWLELQFWGTMASLSLRDDAVALVGLRA